MRLSTSPQGWGAAASAAEESAAGATVRTSATAYRPRADRRDSYGGVVRRLGKAQQAAKAAREAVELVVGQGAQPGENVPLSALAQARRELLGRRRGGDERAPTVLRVAPANRESELLELVDEEACSRAR